MARDTTVSDTSTLAGAYDFSSFVAAYDTSKSKCYQLWREGRGPKRRWLDGKLLIGYADAEAWFTGLPDHHGDRAA